MQELNINHDISENLEGAFFLGEDEEVINCEGSHCNFNIFEF